MVSLATEAHTNSVCRLDSVSRASWVLHGPAGTHSYPQTAPSMSCRITRRLALFAIGATALAPAWSLSQLPRARKPYRIGVLHSESLQLIGARIDAFQQGLHALGYVEGRDIAFEFRWAEGNQERLPTLASELARLNVDVIVTTATEPVLVVKGVTQTIPIVFATVGDAVATGIVRSLAHPGGNATGSTFFSPELMAKRIELAKEAIPTLNRVGALVNPDSQLDGPILTAMERTAGPLGISVERFDARDVVDLDDALELMNSKRIDAVVVHDHPRFIGLRRLLAEHALRHRMPAIGYGEFAEAGGLIGYGVDFTELWRRAAYFVDKILRGSKPDDLPVEQATRFQLTINLNTAKTLGLTIPRTLLARADEVIH